MAITTGFTALSDDMDVEATLPNWDDFFLFSLVEPPEDEELVEGEIAYGDSSGYRFYTSAPSSAERATVFVISNSEYDMIFTEGLALMVADDPGDAKWRNPADVDPVLINTSGTLDPAKPYVTKEFFENYYLIPFGAANDQGDFNILFGV